MITEAQIKSDFSKFADLDSSVTVVQAQSDWIVGFSQNGDAVELRIDQLGGRVLEKRLGETTKHLGYLGLLASAGFGNLRRLAAAQIALLTREAPYIQNVDAHLPIVGEFQSPDTRESAATFLERIEHWLTDNASVPNDIRALVIDGPAGIGKTHLIRRLSYQRAEQFGPGSAPPLLHVQSRGRKLTTLNDVLAGTLNTLRIGLTFDQVPLLARYGLLQVAIDGFDELADPHGYENAWGSVHDFAQSMRGHGAMILSGRDTFIDVKAVHKALSLLNDANTGAAHLRPLTGGEATSWLAGKGWNDNQLGKIRSAGLLEEDSYALRPFFISEIAALANESAEFDDFIEIPLKSLIERIIAREVDLLLPALGKPENKEAFKKQIFDRLVQFFQEVSRTMSDAESDRLDSGSLELIVEMVFNDVVPEESISVLRHRVNAFALLEQDASPEDRRFSHSEIQDYFLSLNYIQLICSNDNSKSLSRNIIGTDLLETFRDVLSKVPPEVYRKFCRHAMSRLSDVSSASQEAKNITALILAGAERFDELDQKVNLAGFSLDEVCLRGETRTCQLSYGSISLLDARGCDFSALSMENVTITTLLADDTTRVSSSIAQPYYLQIIADGRATAVYDPTAQAAWLSAHQTQVDTCIEDSEEWRLLVRIARVINRQKWIRDVDDDLAGKLLHEPAWEKVKEVLTEYNLLQIRDHADAAGPRSKFYRVLGAESFLTPAPTGVVATIRERLSS